MRLRSLPLSPMARCSFLDSLLSVRRRCYPSPPHYRSPSCFHAERRTTTKVSQSLRQERAQTSIWGMLSNTVCARPPTQQPPHASYASRPARLPARSSRRGSFARPPIPPSLPWCIDLGSSGTGGGPRAAGPRSSRLALVAARVPCEGPHGEDITVLRVRDAARAVEDASDALLLPVAILALLRH